MLVYIFLKMHTSVFIKGVSMMGKIFSVVIMISLLFLVACGIDTTYEPEQEPPTIYYECEQETFPEPPPAIPIVHFQPTQMANFNHVDCTITRRNGFYLSKRADSGRRYYFSNDTEESNLAFLNTTEHLIAQIESQFSLGRPPLRVFKADNVLQYRPRTHEATINHDDVNTLGWLIHTWSEGRLPVWFSVAVETQVRAQLGLFEPVDDLIIPEYFGDLLFTPREWGKEEHTQAINTAYWFAAYLREAGRLHDLIDLYMSQETDAANELAMELFDGFTGGVTHRLLVRVHMVESIVGGADAYRIFIPTNKANYMIMFGTFEEYLDMPFYRMMEHIGILDDAITFVYNWFTEHLSTSFTFRPINTRITYGRSDPNFYQGFAYNAYTMGIYNIYRRIDYLPIIFKRFGAHEAGHVIARQTGIPIANCPIEEGLVMYIENLALHPFLQQNEYYYDIWREDFISNFTSYASRALFHNQYNETWLSDQPERADALYNVVKNMLSNDGFNTAFHVRAHTRAYFYLNHFDLIPPGPVREFILVTRRLFEAGGALPSVNSHFTGQSFTLYLIDNYGIDKFMQFFHASFNHDRFESIYGTDIHIMAERWQQFLTELIEELRADVMAILEENV